MCGGIAVEAKPSKEVAVHHGLAVHMVAGFGTVAEGIRVVAAWKVPVAYVVPGSPSPRDKLRLEVAAREVGGWRATPTTGVLHEVRAYLVARKDVARANALGKVVG